MNVLNFLLQNLGDIITVGGLLVAWLLLYKRKQFKILDKIVLSLVTEAERKYGAGTGAVKLSAVVEWLYPKIPALVRVFVTESEIERLIERVLAEAQKKWESNSNLSTYITKTE